MRQRGVVFGKLGFPGGLVIREWLWCWGVFVFDEGRNFFCAVSFSPELRTGTILPNLSGMALRSCNLSVFCDRLGWLLRGGFTDCLIERNDCC
jgi:hypothetical protein